MSSDHFYIRQGRKIQGPFDIERLRRLASLGRFSRAHQISTDRSNWFSAVKLDEVFGQADGSSGDAVRATPAAEVLMDPTSSNIPQPFLRRFIAWIVLAVLILAVAGGGSTWWFLLGPGRTNYENEIVGIVTDENQGQAVGLLVNGKRYVTRDGIVFERVHGGLGSCFLISPSGYILTNKHVIEPTQQLMRAKTKLRTEREKFDLEDLEPILFAYINKKEYPAEIVHVSKNYDMAIVKVKLQNAPYFPLSTSALQRGSRVWALGFPGAATIELSVEGEIKKLIREKTAFLLRRQFDDSDFEYTLTDGIVSRVISKEGVGNLIQHSAAISPGNSGGPLISPEGTIYGINTFVPMEKVTATNEKGAATTVRIPVAPGIFYSLTFDQMRDEIDEHVPDAIWK